MNGYDILSYAFVVANSITRFLHKPRLFETKQLFGLKLLFVRIRVYVVIHHVVTLRVGQPRLHHIAVIVVMSVCAC